MRLLLFLLIGVFTVGPAHAGEMHRLSVGGFERTYYLHVPADLPAEAPLVIMLHGAAEEGAQVVRRLGWEELAEKEHFIVVGPNAMPVHLERPAGEDNMRVWNSGRAAGYYPESTASVDDPGFMLALMDDIARIHGIDRRRIYVAGFSNGGYLANSLGQLMPDRIAAIVTVGSDFTPLVKSLARPISVLFVSGDRDIFTPVKGGRIKLIWGEFFQQKASHHQLTDYWRVLDDCPAARVTGGPWRTRIETSGPCRDGTEVQYLLMTGVDHRWPTGDPFSLTKVAWTFFQRFSLPAPRR